MVAKTLKQHAIDKKANKSLDFRITTLNYYVLQYYIIIGIWYMLLHSKRLITNITLQNVLQ